jgi:radical SAM superfamily enzyme YgiQ (UPF0313 family)
MLLYLINPANPLVGINKTKQNRWNKYRVWQPLGLLVLAGLTPPEWEIKVIDENLGVPDYSLKLKPDLVGITAFTSQVGRAYELAKEFKERGVPVVMGGIHASMCFDEALEHVDSVVIGEGESVWHQVLEDANNGCMQRIYKGGYADMAKIPHARHDLVQGKYRFGSIQTTRGCPLNCSFCSVTPFNGSKHRHRPIENVVEEFKAIKDKYILVVDDNLIGTSKEHIERSKELFRAMIKANLKKKWIAQATINLADDDELLSLARKAGCAGVFIGFESTSSEGLVEVNKRFNMKNSRDFKASVAQIRRHKILVIGSFIMGLDVDEKGIGRKIAETANSYGLDLINVMFLTPFPGTQLWEKLESEGRIIAGNFPDDWKYYTLTYPVAKYKHLRWEEMLKENRICFRTFYSPHRVTRRIMDNIWHLRQPFWTIIANLTIISNAMTFYRKAYKNYDLSKGGLATLETILSRSAVTTAIVK